MNTAAGGALTRRHANPAPTIARSSTVRSPRSTSPAAFAADFPGDDAHQFPRPDATGQVTGDARCQRDLRPGRVHGGTWSWVPYLVTLLVASGVAYLSIKAINRTSDKRNQP